MLKRTLPPDVLKKTLLTVMSKKRTPQCNRMAMAGITHEKGDAKY